MNARPKGSATKDTTRPSCRDPKKWERATKIVHDYPSRRCSYCYKRASFTLKAVYKSLYSASRKTHHYCVGCTENLPEELRPLPATGRPTPKN